MILMTTVMPIERTAPICNFALIFIYPTECKNPGHDLIFRRKTGTDSGTFLGVRLRCVPVHSQIVSQWFLRSYFRTSFSSRRKSSPDKCLDRNR